jgi:ubiquinone/menaquinone biosynthesis C-methylase UbiE
VNKLKPKRILKTDAMNEVGSGLPSPGGIVGNLQTTADVDVVEIDPTKANRAREVLDGKAQVWLGDIRYMPFRECKYDLIIDASTLDHVPFEQMPMALDEYRRVLKPGGHAAIMTWAVGNVQPYITNHKGSWTPDYTCYFPYDALVQAIIDRFEIIERQRFYEDDNGFMTYFLVKKKEEDE